QPCDWPLNLPCALELIAQGDLHLPHIGGCAGVLAKAAACGSKGVQEPGEVRVIQEIEDLPAKLEVLTFSDLNQFRDCHVEIREPIQAQVIAPAGSLVSDKWLAYCAGVNSAGKRAGVNFCRVAVQPGDACAEEKRVSDCRR